MGKGRVYAFEAMYYVIQVKTGQEQKTIDDIKRHMKDVSYFDVFSPSRKALRKYKGEFKEVTERCFPGYIFVETENVEKLFFDLYWVPGFTRILGREGLTYHFASINEEESRMIDILYNASSNRVTPISDIEVKEGDEIMIIEGPLMGVKSRIVKVNLHKRYALVELNLFSQRILTKVGINIITKLHD